MLAGIAAPISLLDQAATQGHYHLALTHLIESNERYCEFYKCMTARGDKVEVDNSVVEAGESLSIEHILQAAQRIGATGLVLPDRIGDGYGTVALVQEALDWLEMYSPYSIERLELMAVPHGQTPYEWFESYFQLAAMPQVNTIGISMFDSDLFPGGRANLCALLHDMGLINGKCQYHMLGCWRDMREVYEFSRFPWVRSMDTGIPVRLGLQGYKHPRLHQLVDPSAELFRHRHADFTTSVDMNLAIQYNIDLYLCWAQGGYA